MHAFIMKLRVKPAPRTSAGNDIVHIHIDKRAYIATNKVCKLRVGNNYVYATVRGNTNIDEILIDNQLRLGLDVEIDKEYEFQVTFKKYYFLLAPFQATNMGVRAAYYIATISFFISLLSTLFPLIFN